MSKYTTEALRSIALVGHGAAGKTSLAEALLFATGAIPAKGSVVEVETGSAASGFNHRDEYVYLPPAWFASNPPPRLPLLMMIGGEFNTPADWLRAGNAITTVDDFAAAHQGNAPVLVFVDPGGSFNNDTECVNGPRGNSADHLVKDVLPFMTANYGVSTDRRNRGIDTGHIGTEIAYTQGGYEVQASSSNTAPQVEKVLMDAMRRLSDAVGSLKRTSDGIYRALDDRTSLGAGFVRRPPRTTALPRPPAPRREPTRPPASARRPRPAACRRPGCRAAPPAAALR